MDEPIQSTEEMKKIILTQGQLKLLATSELYVFRQTVIGAFVRVNIPGLPSNYSDRVFVWFWFFFFGNGEELGGDTLRIFSEDHFIWVIRVALSKSPKGGMASQKGGKKIKKGANATQMRQKDHHVSKEGTTI